jgi:hypothetical protein
MQQSELALFAQEFERGLAPLAAALRDAARCLRSAGSELPLDPSEFQETCGALEGELAVLLERVAKERASVFVFGPAKSGKSTLLDALAGASVSEVSILPGYPCVARVRHAAREEARLQRFDGGGEELGDLPALRLALQRAHHELAARVREVHCDGEVFDPARHLQRAVRRIERAQPAELLAQGALELVECPPIHAPLFPSHAEMLIGEPDHARAGVFVVRAAQLADDAVFDGIEELLAAFERLILVVNLDERARDLSRAGELAASPEREDPGRLIAAFEELSTCAPLVHAIRSGRVPVQALDLLAAARARRQGGEEGPAPGPRARFQDLLQELARVLDSHEALRALQTSSLRRAQELGHEAHELSVTPGLGELAARRDALERERASQANARAALARLAARERAAWEREGCFEGLRTRLAEKGTKHARVLARELEVPLARALEDWFASEQSLAELLASGLEARLAAAQRELARTLESAFSEDARLAAELAPPSASVRADLEAARVSLSALLESAAGAARVGAAPASLRPLDVHAIPVRMKLGQRLLRRDPDEIRRALLGPPEAPARPLSSAEKARRLGDEGRAAMQRSAVERARAILAEEAQRAARVLVEALVAGFLAELEQTAVRERARMAAPLAALETRLTELTRLAEALSALAPACARARAGLEALAERCESSGVLVPAARGSAGNAGLQPGSLLPSVRRREGAGLEPGGPRATLERGAPELGAPG